jgi:transcriptional regulator with XRE-family HTH domain
MITYAQMKAGRALLSWKQSDLAEACGVSLPSINNIERNAGSPRQDTLRKIQNAMEMAGVQFIEDNGVIRKKEYFEVQQFDGLDFIKRQNEDLFSCMLGPNDEALMCSLDESMFLKHAPDQIMCYEAHHQQTKFKERILIAEGDTFYLANPSAYRWIPKDLVGKIPYLIYKNRFVLIMWDIKRVVIVKNQSVADSFRRQFDHMWSIGKRVPNLQRKLEDKVFVADLGGKLRVRPQSARKSRK